MPASITGPKTLLCLVMQWPTRNTNQSLILGNDSGRWFCVRVSCMFPMYFDGFATGQWRQVMHPHACNFVYQPSIIEYRPTKFPKKNRTVAFIYSLITSLACIYPFIFFMYVDRLLEHGRCKARLRSPWQHIYYTTYYLRWCFPRPTSKRVAGLNGLWCPSRWQWLTILQWVWNPCPNTMPFHMNPLNRDHIL